VCLFLQLNTSQISVWIESIQINLSTHFHNVASGQIIRIYTLEINKCHPVVYARRLTTQYGSTLLLTLQSEDYICVKMFLPKRYSDVIDYVDIYEINTGKKYYKLIYNGKAGFAYILHMDL